MPLPPAVGIDIIEIERVQGAVARWGSRFLERVYTPAELELCRGRPASLAARFAAKEAVMKALGARGLGWREIEVLHAPDGKPLLRLYGRVQARAGPLALSVSLSHSRSYAVACVVGTG